MSSNPLPDHSASLSATIKGFQTMWDEGTWDDNALASAVMHLDVDMEGEPGEIAELREKLLIAEWDRSTLQTERDAAILSATMELRAAGNSLARAVRGLDSYAALGGAPMERSERADAALGCVGLAHF